MTKPVKARRKAKQRTRLRPSFDAAVDHILHCKTTIVIEGKPRRMTYLEAILLRIVNGYAKGEHPHFELAQKLGFVDKPQPFVFEVSEEEARL
jgi:hypothetical protein